MTAAATMGLSLCVVFPPDVRCAVSELNQRQHLPSSCVCMCISRPPEKLPCSTSLQMDRAASVRRKLLSFATAAVRVRPSPAVLSTAAPCVQGMLSDDQPQLAREAAQAAHTLLDKALVMLAGLPQVRVPKRLVCWWQVGRCLKMGCRWQVGRCLKNHMRTHTSCGAALSTQQLLSAC